LLYEKKTYNQQHMGLIFLLADTQMLMNTMKMTKTFMTKPTSNL